MAKAKKEKQRKPLEQTIWDACSKLRSNMSGLSYMYFVMGLIFLKFVNLKFEQRYNELINSEDAPFVEEESFYKKENVFFLTKISKWENIKNNAKAPNIGIIIDKALEDIEKNNVELKGALPTNVYSKTTLPPEKFASLIEEIDKIKIDDDHPMNDLIGKVYQYFLNKFAIKTADEKGEFYTPDNIVDLITTLIEPYKGKVYDPCCGSGGMFVQSYKFVESHKGNVKNISVYGQESNPDTWKLAKMNLAIRGINADLGKSEADTFSNDQHKSLKANYIIANPPFNLPNWRTKQQLLDDNRWKGYGVPPVSNANYAWILHMVSKLKDDGVAGFLLANGALGDSDTKEIRKNLIKNNKVEAIIVLPREMFYYTDISVTLWIIDNANKKEREVLRDGKKIKIRNRQNEILFIDLRTWGHKTKEGYTELSLEDMQKVKETYNNWQSLQKQKLYKDIPEYCKSVTNDIIGNAENDYSLVPSKYIEFIDHDLDINFKQEMKRIQQEMKELLKEEKKSQKELEDAFKGIGYEIK